MSSKPTTAESMEWILRLCQSFAFFFHGLLGMMEPCTGCLHVVFNDYYRSMPKWFWPTAGIMLWVVAAANFSSIDVLVLMAQAYIAAFHMGGFFYHLRLKHPPVTGLAPAVFAVFAVIVVAIRLDSWWIAMVGWILCTGVAYYLSLVLVKPPPEGDEGESLLEA